MAQVDSAVAVDDILEELDDLARVKRVEPNQEFSIARLKKSLQRKIDAISSEDEFMAFSLQLSVDSIDGRFEDVTELYSQYLDSDQTVLHHNMAMSYLYHYDIARAVECDRRCFNLCPDDPLVRESYGLMLLDNGSIEEAFEVLRGGAKLQSDRLDKFIELASVIYYRMQEMNISPDAVQAYFIAFMDFARSKEIYLLDRSRRVFTDEGVSWVEIKYKTGLDFDTNDELEDELTDLFISQDIDSKLMGLINFRFV